MQAGQDGNIGIGMEAKLSLVACHECDLLQWEAPLAPGAAMHCGRCGALLYRHVRNSLDRTLAFTLAATIFFVLAMVFPIVGLEAQGQRSSTTLWGTVRVLFEQGMASVAILVFITTILMPTLELAAMLYMLAPLKFSRVVPGLPVVFRLVEAIHPWGMVEVFLLGTLVALAKLTHMANLLPDIALWSFAVLIVLLSAAAQSFDAQSLWTRVEALRGRGVTEGTLTADRAERLVCHVCGLIHRPAEAEHRLACARCGAHLHRRKPSSITRTWAFAIAALILYVPANTLPVMETGSLFGSQRDTILSGVVYLWVSGSWPLAALIFFASIVVPLAKILAVLFLVGSVQFRWKWAPRERTQLYRIVEFVGRWSMIDIFVVALLAALVQFDALATIEAGSGAVAFGAVVVLSIFAAEAFDPRLIWDPVRRDDD